MTASGAAGGGDASGRARILVIKLGALGDFIYALGPMQAIRRHHPDAEIILLTRAAYQELARRSGLFDAIRIDAEPKPWQPAATWALRGWLRGAGFRRVYDLQTSDRTGWYFRLFWPGPWPEWSGIARSASHHHHYVRPTLTHTLDRQRTQLGIAGIADVRMPDLAFMDGDVARFALPEPFALLVPGSSRRMAVKRWPADRYGAIARQLAGRGIAPVLLGGEEEADAIAIVAGICPEAVSLAGRTTIFDIPALGRRAVLCIGNDTGPMHMAALAGCPTVALFSTGSFPDKAAPRGDHVRVLVRDALADLPVAEVAAAALALGK